VLEERSTSRELLVTLDDDATGSLHVRLERRLREDVRAGRLRPGTALPSTRDLAQRLGVSRGVVVEAYAQLAAEGYLTARRGSGTRVASAMRAAEADGGGGLDRHVPRYSFHPGQPDVAAFPRDAWLASARRALRDAGDRDLGYPHPSGAPLLREVLAEHLGRVRGVVADPRRVIVTTGLVQGAGLVFRALRATGGRRVGLEDPGWPGHRAPAEHAGLEVVPIPVDADGARVEVLEDSDVDAVVVTPAHQAPMGTVLAPERRAALLAWAEARDAIVFEDDYDAEYRYDREPVGALQGLAPDRVVYAGSTSKVLAPALRLAWLVVPPRLRRAVAHEKAIADLGTPVLEQLTLADFIATGALDRHVRRMRRRYGERRDAFVDLMHRHLPEAEVAGVAAGLNAVVWLPDGTDENAVVTAAWARGLEVHGLAPGRIDPAGARPALVLGYAALAEPALEPAIVELAAAYRAAA
jgi:GntR family transcriptional regulator/MocR family aminotransferase